MSRTQRDEALSLFQLKRHSYRGREKKADAIQSRGVPLSHRFHGRRMKIIRLIGAEQKTRGRGDRFISRLATAKNVGFNSQRNKRRDLVSHGIHRRKKGPRRTTESRNYRA